MDTTTAQPPQQLQPIQSSVLPQPSQPAQHSYADAYQPPVIATPGTDQPVNDQTTSDQPANDQPTNDQPNVGQFDNDRASSSDQPVPMVVSAPEPVATTAANDQDTGNQDDGQAVDERQPSQPEDQASVDQAPPANNADDDVETPPAERVLPVEPVASATQVDQATGQAAPVATDSVAPTAPATPSEVLADQNIFEMLGVTTGTPEQHEQFLDELQQVIWEDFIEHDTSLLLTDSEQAELKTLMRATPDKSLEQQEQVVVFLEKLIPDLEDIMLEKALQLKEEMARERLKALRELHRNDTDKLVTVDRAEQLMSQEQWRSASEALNSLS